MKPTRRPTRIPTSQPSSRPSGQPTMAPSSPTSVPTSSPTFDYRVTPIIVDKYRKANATYFCHRRHIHSTPNPWRRIFGGLSLDSRVYIKTMVVTMSPYDPRFDEIGLKVDKNALGDLQITSIGLQEKMIDGVRSGVLEYFNSGTVATLASDWDRFLNLVTYRLNLDTLTPSACDYFVENQYKRQLRVHVVDRYGRISNTVFRYLDFKTAALIFTNEKTVKINNDQPLLKVFVDRVIDPVYFDHPFVNITSVDKFD